MLLIVITASLTLALLLLWFVRQDPVAEGAPMAEAPRVEELAAIEAPDSTSVDILLVGAGAMSSTLGMLLLQLDPSLKICMVEKLGGIARESTDALNNAGTGHAGFCELNYTPEREDGSIETKKAFQINAEFEESLQFWSYLVERGLLPDPQHFIHQVPHFSFVMGREDVDFLRRRHELLRDSVAFGDMEYSSDHGQLREWLPLIMAGRRPTERVAATRVRYGADVDFGSLARAMTDSLQSHDSLDVRACRQVVDLRQLEDRRWMVEIHNTHKGCREVVYAKKVFLGAGGGALPLLQKSGIPEGKGYGGFPVGGQWLICKEPGLSEQHWGKVYGKAALGAPPMSTPHLDTRTIDGERCLLFGPFAGFTTKFLKQGSLLDFPASMTAGNIIPMTIAGLDNIPLTIYLVKEVLQSQKSRVDSLRRYYGEARYDDWMLEIAGQRVQIIKATADGRGKLEFGTEVVSSADGSLAALLGASPGASTAVHAMIDVISRCFPEEIQSEAWRKRLKEMVPSYGEDLLKDDDLFRNVRAHNNATLKLDARA